MNDDVLSPGMVVGETYDVEQLIGRGAMGQVFSATHRRLPGLKVAIKVMTGQTLGADRLMRFRREAEIAAKLSHPNIVQIIDYNTLLSGQPYLVMEFLRGESLHARLKRGPLQVEALKRIVREVGAALDAAHHAGVVHRDLKPENVFLVPTPTGDQAKVLDFGISKMNDGALVQTSDSMIIGTPRYMSPEQAMGLNSQLTPRSDVFALGTMCYEALSGKPMFESENVAQLLYQIAQVPHAPLLSLVPEVPLNVARAIENALVKAPLQRTPDVATFVRELTGTQLTRVVAPLKPVLAEPSRTQEPTRDERVVPVRPDAVAQEPVPRPPTRPAVTRKRSMLGPMILLASTLLVISGTGAFMWAQQHAQQRAPPPTRAKPAEVTPPPTGGTAELVLTPPVAPSGTPAFEDAGLEVLDAGAARLVTLRPQTPRSAVKAGLEKPLTEKEQMLIDPLLELRQQEDWAGLLRAQKSVMTLARASAARRKGMLLVFEAACARRETNVTAIFNRLVTDHPDARKEATDLCRKHFPDQVFDR